MNVTEISFVKKVDISKTINNELELPFSYDTHNHLATMHASAQFTLAETTSGELLQTVFPELVGKMLRDAKVKFKKTAVENTLTCTARYNWFVQKIEH